MSEGHVCQVTLSWTFVSFDQSCRISSVSVLVAARGTWLAPDEDIRINNRMIDSLIEARLPFQARSDSQFVSFDQFITCLTSRTRYVRVDEPEADLLGLQDEETGHRIYITREELDRAHVLHVAN